MSASAPTSVTSTQKDVVEPRVTFLDLPPEVRNMIYRLLFKDGIIMIQQANILWQKYQRMNYCIWEERPSNVVKLTIHYGKLKNPFDQDLEDWTKRNIIIIPTEIRCLWDEGKHKVLLPLIKKKLETHADATLKLEYGVTCRNWIRAVIHVELLTQKIWITEANSGGKILMEPRSVPTFVAALDNP
ncbi:hypothetical protein LTS15_010117 [Exophiala xenobiotica]|nr:hypothetical protein LTS15_010117 [Exophiala xenobiotica]